MWAGYNARDVFLSVAQYSYDDDDDQERLFKSKNKSFMACK